MKRTTSACAVLAMAGLAACSSSSGDGDGGEPGIVSSGILTLEFPSASERNGLPDELNQLLDDVQMANEEGVALTPTGNATYNGTFGIGVDNDAGTLVSGNMVAVFDLASTSMDVEFTPTEVIDVDNPTVSGSFRADDMVVTDGRYSGGLSGSVLVDGSENVTVSGNLNGATTANETFGGIDGVLSSDRGGDSDFGGFFYGQ